jgi:hypothetical protein
MTMNECVNEIAQLEDQERRVFWYDDSSVLSVKRIGDRYEFVDRYCSDEYGSGTLDLPHLVVYLYKAFRCQRLPVITFQEQAEFLEATE